MKLIIKAMSVEESRTFLAKLKTKVVENDVSRCQGFWANGISPKSRLQPFPDFKSITSFQIVDGIKDTSGKSANYTVTVGFRANNEFPFWIFEFQEKMAMTEYYCLSSCFVLGALWHSRKAFSMEFDGTAFTNQILKIPSEPGSGDGKRYLFGS